MPKRWPTVPLGEVAAVIRGVSFDKGDARDAPGPGLLPVLRAGNIGDGLDLTNDLIWVSRRLISEEQRLREQDVAIAMSSGSRDVVGKTAQLRQPWLGSVGAFCAIIRFQGKLHPRFGAHWLRSSQFTAWRGSQAKGVNIQNLRKSDLEAVQIPLPPLAEQRRFVAILDEADALRQRRAQADRRTADFIPALFHQMFGDPATNPKRWPVVPVSSFVGEFQGGRSILTDGTETPATKYRVLKVSAVTWKNYQPEESKPAPPEYEPPNDHIVRLGDVLFSRANTSALVAATVYVFDTPPNILLSDKTWRFVWREPRSVEPLYIWALFQHPSVRAELSVRATGTGGSMKNISKPKVLSLPVPVPPLSLQRAFASRVSELRALEAAQARSRARLDALFASLLDRAFKGEL